MNQFKKREQKKQGRLFLAMLAILIFTTHSGLFAQEKTIAVLKGVVKNDENDVLPGATVAVKGTKTIVTTQKDGSFELKSVPEGATLRITFVGYTPKEIKLKAGQSSVNVTMESASNTLDEVLVNTGLYRRPTGNFTGASKTFSGEELKEVNPTNVLQALSVLEPSLRIQEDNLLGSDPNMLPTLQLRGENNLPINTIGGTESGVTPVSNGDIMSSYLANPNQPLIILDGFQTTLQTIFDMDINRIAKITVLKDAAATTAYGSKAANGVIVVETRQPASGKPRITYSFNVSMSEPILNSYNLLDAEGLLEAQRIAGVYSNPNNQFNDVALKQWYDYRLYQAKSGVNTDWLAQPVRTGVGAMHSINMGGGVKSIRYSLGVNFGYGAGVMKGSGRQNVGLSYMLGYSGHNFNFSNTTTLLFNNGKNTPWGSFNDYAEQFPYFSPFDSLGNVTKIFEPNFSTIGIPTPAPGGIFTNAAYNAQIAIKNYSYYTQLTNNTNLDWRITNNLRMNLAISFSNNLPGSEVFFPADHTFFVNAQVPGFSDLGSYTQNRGKNAVIDGRLGINYNKRFGKSILYTSMGVTGQETRSSSSTIKVTGIPNDYLDELGMANGYGLNTKPGTTQNLTRSLTTYASLSYNYDNRYTAEVTINASGSSQFGANNRLAPFWATGLAWNIDKEKFFNKNGFISSLRLRATTGITGNQNFGSGIASPVFLYDIQNNYRLQLGAQLQGYANPDLKWQQTIKNNIGLNAGLLKGRLNVNIDYFIENTDNLILPLEVAPSTGFPEYLNNLGATRNTGYEISLGAPIIRNQKRNIFWTMSLNAAHVNNIITKLSPAIQALNDANNSSDLKQSTPLPRFEVGQSMTRIWAVKSLGIDPATGKEVYEKLDGTKTFTWDPNDKQPVGDKTSKVKGMIASNLTYRGFTFNITMSYQYGGQMYNQTLVDKIENVNLLQTNADERVLTERWKQPGDRTSFKSLVANGSSGLQLTNSTSRFVQDNNYIEAASLTFGYTFDKNLPWVKKLHLSTPKIFITQNNIFRIATIETERGTSYPFARSFNIGLSTTF